AREPPEDEREDDHRQERLQDGPGHSDRGLLVADGDVTPGQCARELPEVPELAKVEMRPAWGRAYDGETVDPILRLSFRGVGRRLGGNLRLGTGHPLDASQGVGPDVLGTGAQLARSVPRARRSEAPTPGSRCPRARGPPRRQQRTRLRTMRRRRSS